RAAGQGVRPLDRRTPNGPVRPTTDRLVVGLVEGAPVYPPSRRRPPGRGRPLLYPAGFRVGECFRRGGRTAVARRRHLPPGGRLPLPAVHGLGRPPLRRPPCAGGPGGLAR